MSPYLFVLAMEYLQKELSMIVDHLLFMFHPRSNKLRVMHICFVVDLLMLYKADVPSVKLMSKAFSGFSKVTSLKDDTRKVSIYISGVKNQANQAILWELSFVEDTLLFRYFDVPLSS